MNPIKRTKNTPRNKKRIENKNDSNPVTPSTSKIPTNSQQIDPDLSIESLQTPNDEEYAAFNNNLAKKASLLFGNKTPIASRVENDEDQDFFIDNSDRDDLNSDTEEQGRKLENDYFSKKYEENILNSILVPDDEVSKVYEHEFQTRFTKEFGTHFEHQKPSTNKFNPNLQKQDKEDVFEKLEKTILEQNEKDRLVVETAEKDTTLLDIAKNPELDTEAHYYLEDPLIGIPFGEVDELLDVKITQYAVIKDKMIQDIVKESNKWVNSIHQYKGKFCLFS